MTFLDTQSDESILITVGAVAPPGSGLAPSDPQASTCFVCVWRIPVALHSDDVAPAALLACAVVPHAVHQVVALRYGAAGLL